MAFKLKQISENTKPKDFVAQEDMIDFVIKDSYTGQGDYYLFILDKKPSIAQQASIIKTIEQCTHNYMLVTAVTCLFNKATLKGQGITEFFQTHRSPWRKLVDKNGQHAKAIMTFGGALYSANGSADIMVDDFMADQFVYPYYYLGHEVWKCDTHIFPVHEVDELYPRLKDPTMSNVNYKTRFFYAQLDRMTNGSKLWTPMLDDVECIEVSTKEDAKKVLKENMGAKLLAFDTETNSLQFHHGKLHCIQLCWDGIHSYFFLWDLFRNDKEMISSLYENFTSCERITGTNEKFDMEWLWYNGVPLFRITDASDMICHCLHSDRSKGLKPSSYFFTHFGGYDLKLDKWKKETKSHNYTKVPPETLKEYACKDSAASWRVTLEVEALIDEVDKRLPNEKPLAWTLRRWYEMMMMPIYSEIAQVEYRGIYINMDLITKHRNQMLEDIKAKSEELCKIWNLPPNFNFGSAPEVARLFERLGFTDYGRNKQGLYLTGDDAIQQWIREGHTELKIFKELKNEKTCAGGFLGDLEKKTGWIPYEAYHEEDNSWRIHQSYKVFGTTSYRFIGKDPNFQNIPTRGNYAPLVKKCIDTPTDNLNIIISESGKEYHLADFELIKVVGKGYIRADEITEDDTVDESDEATTVKRCSLTKNGDSWEKPDPIFF